MTAPDEEREEQLDAKVSVRVRDGHLEIHLKIPVKVIGAGPSLPNLTTKELPVFQGLIRGLSNKELSAQLGCSISTVKAHVREILLKTALPDRIKVMQTYWELGHRQADKER